MTTGRKQVTERIEKLIKVKNKIAKEKVEGNYLQNIAITDYIIFYKINVVTLYYIFEASTPCWSLFAASSFF